MDGENRRRFERYDAFIQLNLFVPISLGEKAYEVTGWIKNVSQNGIALEVYIFSSDEIDPLLNIVESEKPVMVSVLFSDDSPIEAKCKIAWGKFIEDKRLYALGLQILNINPLQKDRWDSFIEKLSQ